MLRSVQLQDDLEAIHKGTLSGTAATTKIQADQPPILTSMGLTSAQITQIQSDQTALQTAIQTASSSSTSSSTSTSTSTSTTTYTFLVLVGRPDRYQYASNRPQDRYSERRSSHARLDRRGTG